jgi:hypothetical protein
MIRFKVAPYALYDVMNALENESSGNTESYLEKGVTKEDNDLVVWAEKHYFPQSSDSRECCSDPERLEGTVLQGDYEDERKFR